MATRRRPDAKTPGEPEAQQQAEATTAAQTAPATAPLSDDDAVLAALKQAEAFAQREADAAEDAVNAAQRGAERKLPPDGTQALGAAAERMRLAEQIAATEPEPRPQSTYDPASTEQLEQQIARSERSLLLQEARVQRARREEVEAALRERRKVRPVLGSPIEMAFDEATPINRDGTPAGTPGHYKRWVRLIGQDGQPTDTRVGEFRRAGYRPVKDQNGRPIVEPFGMLMECTPEAEGRRRAYHASTVVPLERLEEDLMEKVDRMNSAAGRRVASTFKMAEHGVEGTPPPFPG